MTDIIKILRKLGNQESSPAAQQCRDTADEIEHIRRMEAESRQLAQRSCEDAE